MSVKECPYLNPLCKGVLCGNFNEPSAKFGNPAMSRGCKGDNPTARWARWYLEWQRGKESGGNPS